MATLDYNSSSIIFSWTEGETFVEGNYYAYNSKVFVCKEDHTASSTFDNTKFFVVNPTILLKNYSYIYDDFISNSYNGNLGWTSSIVGAASLARQAGAGSNQVFGAVEVRCGGTNNNYSSISLGYTVSAGTVSSIRLGGGVLVFECWASLGQLPTAALGGDFQTLIGLGNTDTNAPFTQGVFFDLAWSNGNTDKWVVRTKNTGGTTSSNTSPTIAINTYNKYKIVVNATASSVDFYINNANVATHTANIPTAAGEEVALFFKQVKHSIDTGGVTSGLKIDWMSCYRTLTASRG